MVAEMQLIIRLWSFTPRIENVHCSSEMSRRLNLLLYLAIIYVGRILLLSWNAACYAAGITLVAN